VLSSTVGRSAVCPQKAAALLIGLGPNIEVLGNPSLASLGFVKELTLTV